MRTWLRKFRISAALDGEKPVAPDWRNGLAPTPELRRFAETAASLDRALRGGPETPEPPPSLHAGIMRAVAAAQREAAPAGPPPFLRWLPVPALALALLAGVWWSTHRAPQPGPLAPASAVLEAGQLAAQTLPAALLAPMSNEWQRVSRDLDQTAQFLWASLP